VEGWRRVPTAVVIEDGPLCATSIARHARLSGFEAIVLGTCAAALAYFERARADAIFLDLGLPDGHGLDLLAELRRRGVRTPVLIVSRHCEYEDVARGYALGARFLLKPGVGDEISTFLLARHLTVLGTAPQQVVAFGRRYPKLTDKELEVIAAACIDRDRRAIANLVRCTVETVHAHVSSILRKTGADSLGMVVECRAGRSRAEPSRAEQVTCRVTQGRRRSGADGACPQDERAACADYAAGVYGSSAMAVAATSSY